MPPRGNCRSCDGVIGERDNFLKCATCDYQCHSKCDKRYIDLKKRITDETYQHFESLGFRWFCHECTSIVPKLKVDHESEILSEMKKLCERIGNIEKNLCIDEKTQLTYASVAKGEPERAIVIKHSDKKMSSMKIAKIVEKNFDPVFARVSNLQVFDDKCVIRANLDEKHLSEFADRIKSVVGKGCEAEPLKRKLPRLKIVGNIHVEQNELSNMRLLEMIKKQNTFIGNDIEIKAVKKADPKTNLSDQIIIETTPRAYNAILKAGHITVGFTRCKVYDANIVPRCYKCSLLGHFEKNCLSTKICCPKCLGAHRLKECKSTESKCINCEVSNQNVKHKVDINHPAFDRNCPTAAHRTKLLRSFFKDEKG